MTAPPPALAATPKSSRLRYVPALDGMRGLSLPGTILTHYALFLEFRPGAPSWLAHVGPLALNIQMFFVLSGALITSLLVAEHQRNAAISLKSFYLRRSRRLGPALLAVLPVMAVAELLWTGSNGASPLGTHPWLALGAVAVFFGNWVLFRISGGIGWLGPAWTLGIEEQFYLTWPIGLRALLNQRARRAAVLLALGIALVVGLGVADLLYAHFVPQRTFYASPTQLPSILLGCALGYELTANTEGRLRRLLRSQLVALLGLAGMVVGSIKMAHHPGFMYRGGYVLYAGFACLLIGHCLAVADGPTLVSKVLGWKPFVVIGQISYEAYLVHTIVIIAVAQAWPHLRVYPMMAIDTLLVAISSALFYYLVEQPIRRNGWRVLASRRRPETLGSVAEPRL
ncbi:MAG TPA: acyltransferase [Mycobacteriales bacterium]|nr:acyltransferase [Mycobacteriales bacterium]